MPRFYFHACEGTCRIIDPEGTELPDVTDVEVEALHIARELWAAAMLAARDLGAHRIEVTDTKGRVVQVVPFDAALPGALRARLK